MSGAWSGCIGCSAARKAEALSSFPVPATRPDFSRSARHCSSPREAERESGVRPAPPATSAPSPASQWRGVPFSTSRRALGTATCHARRSSLESRGLTKITQSMLTPTQGSQGDQLRTGLARFRPSRSFENGGGFEPGPRESDDCGSSFYGGTGCASGCRRHHGDGVASARLCKRPAGGDA